MPDHRTIALVLATGTLLALGAGACSDDAPAGIPCGGGTTCNANTERCCGPLPCGTCVDKLARVACPATCGDARASDAPVSDAPASDAPAGQLCGGKVCGVGSSCCGPPTCGFCTPENSGVFCAPSCADASGQ